MVLNPFQPHSSSFFMVNAPIFQHASCVSWLACTQSRPPLVFTTAHWSSPANKTPWCSSSVRASPNPTGDFTLKIIELLIFCTWFYPLVNLQKSMENHHFLWVNPLFLWSLSIAMLNYQRVLFCAWFYWFSSWALARLTGILLWMEEILHHLGWLKPYKRWDKPPINWGRISSIHSILYKCYHRWT